MNTNTNTKPNPFLEAGLDLFYHLPDAHEDRDCPEAIAKAITAYAEDNVIAMADYHGQSREIMAKPEPLNEAEAAEPLNDAVVLGEGGDDLVEFLGREATFLLGEMWGARDRRNTLDGAWNQVTLTWMQWLLGQEGDKNTPAWGFTRHPEGKDKAGAAVVLGSSIGGARKAKAMDEMFAMGIDVDSGAVLQDVVAKIKKLGLLCFVYSSFNHGKRGIVLKRDEVLRKMNLKRDPETSEVRQFLREHDKNRYEEDFIARCTIKDQKHQTTEGVKIVLDTPPLEKFRLLFPLSEAVKLIDLAETHQAALDLWEDKITGLARNVLGVHFDTSCTDVSRLYYTARHPKGSDDWYCAIVQGKPLAFEDIPPMKKSSYTSNREMNAFTMAGGESDGDRPPQCHTPSGASLNEWHRDAKERLMLADLLETLCPDRIRVAGGEAQGTVHIECPFESEHSSEGGTATMAINCVDSNSEYWTIFCHHDACQRRHKLEYLEEMLRQGWFEEDVLFNTEHGFLLEAGDGVDDLFEPQEAKKERARSFEDQAACFDKIATQQEIEEFFKGMILKGVDVVVQANVIAIIAKNTNLTKPTVNKLWKALEEDARRAERTAKGAGIDLGEGGYRDHCDKVADTMADQGDQPSIFQSNGRLAEIRTDEQNALRIENIDKDRYKARIEDRMDFFKENGSVEAPHGIVNNVFHRDRSGMPPLHKIIRAPAFDPEMRLITEPGYHESGVFYHPQEGVVIPQVSLQPSPEEVRKAVDDLVDVMGDFMLDAMSREDLLAAVRDGTPVPSFCSALSVGLTPMCRAFIDGPTPGHLARKMMPRTGATKLLSNVSYMATLSHARPQSLPDNKAEVQKTLVSNFDAGLQFTFFDNLPDSGKVDFGELASAMTAYPNYAGRRLGQTAMVDVKVDTTFMFTGNKTVLSPELAARVLLIVLDPQVERPEDRTGFKYNIDAHVAANGGKYLHAFMTLVQNWIANGCKEWTGKALGGFERHSAIIGGILESAGIMGFLGNRDVLRSTVNTSTPEDDLMDALIEMYHATPPSKDGTLFRVWGADAPPQWNGNGADREKHELAGYRVVSIKEVLEAESIAISGAGYAQIEDGGVIYPDRAKSKLINTVGAMVGSVRELGPDREEEVRKQGRYILKTVQRDKHSTMYKLERLALAN